MVEAMIREGAVVAGGKKLKSVDIVERGIEAGVEVEASVDVVEVMPDVAVKLVELSLLMMSDEGMASGAGMSFVC